MPAQTLPQPLLSPPPGPRASPAAKNSASAHEARKHERHYYLRMYGGRAVDAWPETGRLHAAVGEAKEWWRH